MSVNKYKPFVLVIPEDDANRQLANGFVLHDAVDDGAVQVLAPAGGWPKVIEIFERDYVPTLCSNRNAHVIMLIDFDEVKDRREAFEEHIPDEVKSRVFVVGSMDEPETLSKDLDMAFETIGRELAEDCLKDDFKLWSHPHLIHNENERQRLMDIVKPILFQ